MTPQRWQHVEEIFQAALNLNAEERDRFVSEACANDADLKRNVESLLSQHESGGKLLEKSLSAETVLLERDEDADPMIGRRLGPYRVERQVGRGGMGTVYEAARVDN